ncbi:hypothetical protein F4801DRAFT_12657 [Xylaria longipes]|nr:hypothetical protein F4801DRAFT_12657 [Xylaria longipes]
MLPTSGPSLSAWCAFDKGQAWNPQHIITQPQEARAPLDNANLRYRHYVDRGAVDVQLGLSWGWRGTAVHRGNEVSIQYAGQAAAYYSLGPLLFLKTGARWNLELPLKRSRPSELPSQLCQLSYLPTLPTPGASPSTYTSKVGQDAVETYLPICGSNDACFVALTYTDLTLPPAHSLLHLLVLYDVHPGAAPAFPL